MSDVPWVGVEHEYVVRDPTGAPVDFRTLIDGLGVGRRWLDPGDLRARRLPSGTVLTCDDREAELALPPTELRPGFASACAALAAAERDALAARLAPHVIEGGSTHVSVSGTSDERCRLLAERCAPALMVVANRLDSPGLLVRPRPDRTEVGLEHVEGDALVTLLVLAAGLTLAPLEALRALPQLPVRIEDAVARYGWFVRQDDWLGRRRDDSRSVLTACLEVARRALAEVDPVVGDVEPSTAFGAVLRPRRRKGFSVAPVMATWDLHVLVVTSGRRRGFLAVPGRDLSGFLADLDGGALDGEIRRALRRPGRGVLERREQVVGPTLFGALGRRCDLLARERPPATPAGGTRRAGSRPRRPPARGSAAP